MASLEDVANQISAKLDSITTSTEATALTTADTLGVTQEIRDLSTQTNSLLSTLDVDLNAGVTHLSQGLFAILEVQRAALKLLDHHRKQHDTMICELVTANEQLCGIDRKLAVQVETQAAILASVARIEGIAERTDAAAAADYDREVALSTRLDACCPPRRPEPDPCPEACDSPRFRAPKPTGQDWRPVEQRPHKPVG